MNVSIKLILMMDKNVNSPRVNNIKNDNTPCKRF